ncbi:SdpI family protein [Brevundimonas sp.]|uniref:SdpI family protein n=1 Tax=Brevundimonas sp. TaxID=1871086 RepID=UPI0025D5D4E4|nr:SdpI family protein [Brevundimonas sp.]
MRPNLERIDLASIGVVAAMAAATAYTALYGPEGAVPLHMDLSGTIDRWGTRAEVAWVMALVTVLTAGIAFYCAHVKRDRRTAEHAARSPRGFMAGRILALVAPACAMLLIATLTYGGLEPGESQAPMSRLMMGGISLLFLVIGAFLGKTAPNAFVGLRTYWSLTSRLAWDKSNRLAGRLFFGIGLIGLLARPSRRRRSACRS